MSVWFDRLAFLLALLLIGLLALAAAAAIRFAPDVEVLTGLEIQAGPEPVGLSSRQLGLSDAETVRLEVRRVDGAVSIGGGTGVRVTLVRDGVRQERALGAWPLSAGDRIVAGARSIRVQAVDAGSLVLEGEGMTARWRDGILAVEGSGLPSDSCTVEDGGPVGRALRRVRNVAASWQTTSDWLVFTIGGQVSGPACWGMRGLEAGALGIRRQDGRFWLTAERDGGPVEIVTASGQTTLSRVWLPLDGPLGLVTELRIGGVRYRVAMAEGRVRLTPSERSLAVAIGDRWSLPCLERNDVLEQRTASLDWIGAGVGFDAIRQEGIPVVAAVAGPILLVLSAIGLRQRSRHRRLPAARRTSTGRLLVTVGGCLALPAAAAGLLLKPGDATIDRALLLGLVPIAWGWATVLLAWAGDLRGRAAWLWAAYTTCIGIGLLTQLQLAAGSGSMRWLAVGPVQSSLAVIGVAILVGLLPFVPAAAISGWADRWVTRESRWTKAAEIGASVLIVVLFALHAAVGREAGLYGLQTAEIAKTCIVFAALAGARYLHLVRLATHATTWWRFLFRDVGVALVTLAVALGALLSVSDRSPVIIILATGLCWFAAVAYWGVRASPGGPRRSVWSVVPLVLLTLVLVAAAGWLSLRAGGDDRQGLGDEASERVGFFRHPERFPVSGDQILRAFDLVAASPFGIGLPGIATWAPDGSAGPARPTLPACGDPTAVRTAEPPPTGSGLEPFGYNDWEQRPPPAIESDFVGSFVYSRFGQVVAAVLIASQLLIVGLLCELGIAALGRKGPAPQRRAGLLIGLTLVTVSVTQAIQWTIAWGNTLWLLPVMGQPMSWVSASLNHTVFFAAPCLLLGLVAGRTQAR